MNAIREDTKRVTKPDLLRPFESTQDVIERLLPYHVYEYPAEDFELPDAEELERQSRTNDCCFYCVTRITFKFLAIAASLTAGERKSTSE